MPTIQELNQPEENIKVSSVVAPLLPFETPVKSALEGVSLTKNKLTQLKEHMNQLIDSMAVNSSFFSRSALYWGSLPLWKKIITGIVLTVPFLTTGLLTHVALLFALTIFSLISYTLTSLLLDDHYQQNTTSADQLKSGVANLADIFESAVMSLETLGNNLAAEINQFGQENQNLTKNIEGLEEQITDLTFQAKCLKETEQKLLTTQIGLEQTAETLNGTVEEQSELLRANQIQLNQAITNYKESQDQLTLKTQELQRISTEMGKELQDAKGTATVLRSTVESLSYINIEDEAIRKTFLNKLDEFMTNKEASFLIIAERICEAEKELERVTNQLSYTQIELNRSNEKYNELLQEQKLQIVRLEQIQGTPTPIAHPANKPAAHLKSLGLYAEQGKSSIKTQETQVIEANAFH
jgi:DNA repair exonuclease SbcCD ATPase subunit